MNNTEAEHLENQFNQPQGPINIHNYNSPNSQPISLPKGLVNVSKDSKEFFTEQGTVLEDLEKYLKTSHIACLHGKHGLGKTTNAQEFARRQVENYELIVFLDAAEQVLDTSIVEFADKYIPELQRLSLLELQQVKPDVKFAFFKKFFEDNELWQTEKRGWLLIFDNLESKEQIRKHFPNTNNGNILYTCNDDLYLDAPCEVPINEFSQAEAELFLYKTSSERRNAEHKDILPAELTDIRKILHDYGRLPFVVNKFRVYLYEIPISFGEFYLELKNNEERYLELANAYDRYQYKNEIVAFSISFDKVKSQETKNPHDQLIGKLAVALLNISSFCFADMIPEELLKDSLFRLVDTSESKSSQTILFAEAFRRLQRFDLLNSRNETFNYLERRETPEIIYELITKQETIYYTHRTIQKIVKLKLETESKKEILNEIIEVFANLTPNTKLEYWKIFEKYLSNAESLIEEAVNINLTVERLGYMCNQFGIYQNEIAQYEKAIQFYEKALKVDEKTIGKEHPAYAIHLSNLGNVYRSQGKYNEAIEKIEKALEIGERTIGKNHPAYATRLNNLGLVYFSQGRYDEAIEKFEEALKIGEQTIGKNHPAYATRLNNLGLVYSLQGRYEEAIEKFEEATMIDKETIGLNHPNYAFRLNNLAVVYKSQGKNNKAIVLWKESLEIRKNNLGENHPDVAQSYWWLAVIYHKEKNFKEALDLCEKALKILQDRLPAEHPDIKNCQSWVEKIKSSMTEE